MRETLINDLYANYGRIREDGRTVHEMGEVSAARPSRPADSVEFYRKRCTRSGVAVAMRR